MAERYRDRYKHLIAAGRSSGSTGSLSSARQDEASIPSKQYDYPGVNQATYRAAELAARGGQQGTRCSVDAAFRQRFATYLAGQGVGTAQQEPYMKQLEARAPDLMQGN